MRADLKKPAFPAAARRVGGRWPFPGLAWLATAAVAACSAGPTLPPAPVTRAPAPASPPPPAPPVAEVAVGQVRLGQAGSAADPTLLRPDPAAVDDLVARVGAVQIHERHVWDRLLETNPQQARELVDNLILDCLVAELAGRRGIRVHQETVEAQLAEQEEQLRRRVQQEWGGQLDYEAYLVQELGMDAEEYRSWQRLNLTRTLYRQYAVRYHAMLSERVQVRYIVCSDERQLEEIRQQVQQGASFARLALRHSEDESRKDGGLLPPFGPGVRHPVADLAFTLQPGELSPVVEREVSGQRRFYLVSCVRRIPARDVPFEDVRAEIEEDIKVRPLSRFEFVAFYTLARGEAESLHNVEQKR